MVIPATATISRRLQLQHDLCSNYQPSIKALRSSWNPQSSRMRTGRLEGVAATVGAIAMPAGCEGGLRRCHGIHAFAPGVAVAARPPSRDQGPQASTQSARNTPCVATLREEGG